MLPSPIIDKKENPQEAQPVEAIPKIPPPPTVTFILPPFVFIAKIVFAKSTTFIPTKKDVIIRSIKSIFENAVVAPKRRYTKREILYEKEKLAKRVLKTSL